MSREVRRIYENGNSAGKHIGYAAFDNGILSGIFSRYDARDASYDDELSFGEKLYGGILSFVAPASLLLDAKETFIKNSSDVLFQANLENIENMYRGSVKDFTEDLTAGLAVKAIEKIVGAYIPNSDYAALMVSALDGDSIPTIIASASGIPFFSDLVDQADFSNEKRPYSIQARNVAEEPRFTSADYASIAEPTVFLTYDSRDANREINWAFSPSLNNEVFADASGVSNALLSVGVRDQTVQVGESIAVSSWRAPIGWSGQYVSA